MVWNKDRLYQVNMCMEKHYKHLVNNINLLLNSLVTSISRICKRLQPKHKIAVESCKKLH